MLQKKVKKTGFEQEIARKQYKIEEFRRNAARISANT
jgi:hypothetical protein